MGSIQFRRPGRRLALAVASSAAIMLTAATVRAQDGGGGFFDQLFGVQRQAVAPSYDRNGLFDYAYRDERRRWRAERARRSYAYRQRLKTRYAALPKGDAVDRIAGKQPVDQKAIADNPTKAILDDKTLRPGDIVILPGGPKVYTGGSEARRRLSDFEPVKTSRFLDKKTRQQLLAMMTPVGAMPADQARKAMTVKLKLAQPDEIASVEANAAAEPKSPRVIMPWKTQR